MDQGDYSDKLTVLVDALQTETDLNIREDITFALVRLGTTAVKPLIALLDHSDADIRHHASHALGKIGHKEATTTLIHTLQNDDDPVVVMKAAFSLGQIGDEAAIPALVNTLAHDNPEVQSTVMNVLVEYGSVAVPALLDGIDHDQWPVRECVIDVLGTVQDERAVPALLRAVHDIEWQVAFSAATALINTSAIEQLAAIQDELDPRIQSLIKRARN